MTEIRAKIVLAQRPSMPQARSMSASTSPSSDKTRGLNKATLRTLKTIRRATRSNGHISASTVDALHLGRLERRGLVRGQWTGSPQSTESEYLVTAL